MADFIPSSRRESLQSSRYEALHGNLRPRGTGATSPSSGFGDFDVVNRGPGFRGDSLTNDGTGVAASESSIVSSEFNRRLCILIGAFTYSHSIYHATAPAPTGPIDPTSLGTYTCGVVTVGTLGTSFGSHAYWESWEYGINALDALTQTLDRSGGINVRIGLFETPLVTPTALPKAGGLVPGGKSLPAAMPAAPTVVSCFPLVSEYITLFEALNTAPGFGSANATHANKSMFIWASESVAAPSSGVSPSWAASIAGEFFSPHVMHSGGAVNSFIGVPTSAGPFTLPFSHGGGPTSPAGQQYLVANYGDRGAVTFPNSQGEFLGPAGDRQRWWSVDFNNDTSWAAFVNVPGSTDQRQQPHHILYVLARALRREAFDLVNKRAFFDRTNTFAADTQMPIQGFPPDAVTATAGTTPGSIEVGWTAHAGAPDDGVEPRWRIYLTADSAIIGDIKQLREQGRLFTNKNLNNGLQVRSVPAINKINTPAHREIFYTGTSSIQFFVTMTNVHFNTYLLRSTRGCGVGQSAQQGHPEVAESEIFTPAIAVFPA